MVLQETWLFDGSIYDNLTYGNKNATKEEVEKVLEKARLSSFLNQLPNGYDTIIKCTIQYGILYILKKIGIIN